MAKLAPEQDPQIWNEVAGTYAEFVDPMTGTFSADLVRLAGLKEGERVLDVACGAGAAALPAARAGANVLAVDIAPRFVELLAARAAKEGLSNLQARQMDGHAMDLPDATFDAALSNFGAFLFPERAKAFREMHRVLKPGGRAVLTSFRGPPENQWMAFFAEALRRGFPQMPPPPAPRFLELADPERFRMELSEAGFAEVRIETVVRDVRFSDAARAWSALAEGAPIFRPIMERVGSAGVATFREAFDGLAEERFGKGRPLTLATPVHFAVARKW